MAGSKEIKRRIESVKNTQQITSAMKMVAASKLRKTQAMVGRGDLYRNKLKSILSKVSKNVDNPENIPLLKQREIKKVLIVVISSNKGLCGGYNNHLFSHVMTLCKTLISENKTVSVIAVGKKADEFFTRQGLYIEKSFLDFQDVPTIEEASILSELIQEGYLSEAYDEVYLSYQRFKSAISQVPENVKLLPLSYDTGEVEENAYQENYIFEPSSDEILSSLLTLYFKMMIETALIEARTGEHGARMSAMTAATDNATDLLQTLKLSYNRARQAAITNEITEIVAGVNALD